MRRTASSNAARRPAAIRSTSVRSKMANSASASTVIDPALDDPTLAEDPPFRRLGDPTFEQRVLADQGGPSIPQAQPYRRSVRTRNGIGGRKDDVERRGQCAAVHASRRSLIGHAEGGVTECLRRSLVSRTGSANGLKRPTTMSKGMESWTSEPARGPSSGGPPQVRSAAGALRGCAPPADLPRRPVAPSARPFHAEMERCSPTSG